MLYKNIIASEINKFKSDYVKINNCDFLKCDYKKIEGNKKCIVWIPGRNDYFYHYHITNYLVGYDIYAIMLRNSHAKRNDVFHHIDEITDYFCEIDKLYDFYNLNNYDEIILYGHSTGGLICILYENYNKKNKITKLVLNSPFLKFTRHWYEDIFLNYVGWYFFDYAPNINISFDVFKPNYYTLKMGEDYFIDNKYKTLRNAPVISSWLINIMKHQNKIVNNKIKIGVPSVIYFCDKNSKFLNDFGDSVLDMDENIKMVSFLFDDKSLATLHIIKNSIHDIFCSKGDIDDDNDTLGYVMATLKIFLDIK